MFFRFFVLLFLSCGAASANMHPRAFPPQPPPSLSPSPFSLISQFDMHVAVYDRDPARVRRCIESVVLVILEEGLSVLMHRFSFHCASCAGGGVHAVLC